MLFRKEQEEKQTCVKQTKKAYKTCYMAEQELNIFQETLFNNYYGEGLANADIG